MYVWLKHHPHSEMKSFHWKRHWTSLRGTRLQRELYVIVFLIQSLQGSLVLYNSPPPPPPPPPLGLVGVIPESKILHVVCVFVHHVSIKSENVCSSYRTVIRPSFRTTYKQVTALEWRCCPGFVGEECREGEFLPFFLLHDAALLRLGLEEL